jgi:hypothetical protein
MAGDITRLGISDESFDCVFCAEVLEHIGDLQTACRELVRVAKYDVVVGVPFKQDTRLGRTTCGTCGAKNPPWGHINVFDEQRLSDLFRPLTIVARSFVGRTTEVTNWLSTRLMDQAGNPWGTYSQEESCVACGSPLLPPSDKRSLLSRISSKAAVVLNSCQQTLARPQPQWIHVVFCKQAHPINTEPCEMSS